ncbi:2989_t:CDS:2 [Diversispora eburnea]|uniref:2989_t:CDS:1 n=1 Tax=Diversispora eburnea TaxID=1213867 RepID=A0A9N9A201_9GLOM|nr:2989_t:CDS:2 [Diversispora eburnea]
MSPKAKQTTKQPSVDISISESVREANKISIGNQENLIGLETLEVQIMVKAIIKEFADIKTTLTLRELWTPSTQTRAKGTPRPQNAFMLHRKDVSKEFCRARQSLSVCDSSIIASKHKNPLKPQQPKQQYQQLRQEQQLQQLQQPQWLQIEIYAENKFHLIP